jgi:hypothetical protein
MLLNQCARVPLALPVRIAVSSPVSALAKPVAHNLTIEEAWKASHNNQIHNGKAFSLEF